MTRCCAATAPRRAARPGHRAGVAGRCCGCCATPCSRCCPPARGGGVAVGPLAGRLRRVGAVVVAAGVVGAAHPPSFDRWAAPWLRARWRRWTAYRGRRWAGVLDDCELTREHRRTGAALCPRVLRVRSVTPSIDTVVRADGPRAGPQDLDRPHRRPGRCAARPPGRDRQRRPAVLAIVVERGTAVRPRHPRTRDPDPTPSGGPVARSTSATTSTAARSCSPCRASTCSSPAPPGRASRRCCGTRCGRWAR